MSFLGCDFLTCTSSSNRSELLHSLVADSRDSLVELPSVVSRKKDSLKCGSRSKHNGQKKQSSGSEISKQLNAQVCAFSVGPFVTEITLNSMHLTNGLGARCTLILCRARVQRYITTA